MYVPPRDDDPAWWKGWWDDNTGTLTLQKHIEIMIDVDSVTPAIVIKADSVTLDGNGYTVTGSGSGENRYGVELKGTGVTVKNLRVKGFHIGIYLSSSDNTVTCNTFSNNGTGIYLSSSDNTVTCNTFSNNDTDIEVPSAIPPAVVSATVDATSRWYYDSDNDRLYVHATSNPASAYSNIEGASVSFTNTVFINSKDYITLQNLDIRGGSTASIKVQGSNAITIEDCHVGADACYGVFADNSSSTTQNKGIVRRCTIDSNCQLFYDYDYVPAHAGVFLGRDSNCWEVYENTFKNWGHGAVEVKNIYTDYTANYNKVHDNYITAPDIAYSRAFACGGPDGRCSYNEFYRNFVTNTKTRSQISGDHNLVYYNTIDTMTNCPYKAGGTAQGISVEDWLKLNKCHDNKIYNNVIYNTEEAGIQVWAYNDAIVENNEIINNIVFNCGSNPKTLSDKGLALKLRDHTGVGGLKGNTYQNNDIYNEFGVINVISYRGTAMSVSMFNSQNGTNNDVIGGHIQLDPKFVGASNQNFRLEADSPCIDAGLDVGLPEDYDGNPVSQGSGVDIGAFEYITGLMPPTNLRGTFSGR